MRNIVLPALLSLCLVGCQWHDNWQQGWHQVQMKDGSLHYAYVFPEMNWKPHYRSHDVTRHGFLVMGDNYLPAMFWAKEAQIDDQHQINMGEACIYIDKEGFCEASPLGTFKDTPNAH